MTQHPRFPRTRFWTGCAALLAFAACGDDGEVLPVEGVIDRETFIAVYVDLRAETVVASELLLPDERRDEILERHGVDAESLVEFADVYGRELDFMNAVWSEIEQRLDSLPEQPPQEMSGS